MPILGLFLKPTQRHKRRTEPWGIPLSLADHPLREQTTLLGHTALHSRDFELQWDPQGSRRGRQRASCYPWSRAWQRVSETWYQGGRLVEKPSRTTPYCRKRSRADRTKQFVYVSWPDGPHRGRGAWRVMSKVNPPAKNKACWDCSPISALVGKANSAP